jgi:hypothetical protein
MDSLKESRSPHLTAKIQRVRALDKALNKSRKPLLIVVPDATSSSTGVKYLEFPVSKEESAKLNQSNDSTNLSSKQPQDEQVQMSLANIPNPCTKSNRLDPQKSSPIPQHCSNNVLEDSTDIPQSEYHSLSRQEAYTDMNHDCVQSQQTDQHQLFSDNVDSMPQSNSSLSDDNILSGNLEDFFRNHDYPNSTNSRPTTSNKPVERQVNDELYTEGLEILDRGSSRGKSRGGSRGMKKRAVKGDAPLISYLEVISPPASSNQSIHDHILEATVLDECSGIIMDNV